MSRRLQFPHASRAAVVARAVSAVAGLLTAGLLAALPAPAGAAEPHRIGTAPRIPTGAQALGRVAATTTLQATVALTPQDPAGLAAYAQDVSIPGSPDYHRFLTVAQFAQRFGPSTAAVDQVRSALAAAGLQVGPLAPNHLSVGVSAPAATMASAFSTTLQRYRLPDGSTGYANQSAPAMSAAVAPMVQGVVGLDTLTIPTPMDLQTAHAASQPVAHTSSSATGPQACSAAQRDGGYGGYTAPQIASAYGLAQLYGQGDLGAGKTIAVYELEPYSASDIAAYQSCYGTSTSITNVAVDGGPGSTGAGSGEAALDIEDLIGLAPAASIRVYQGPNSGNGPYDTYQKIVADNTAQVISTSWGLCEAYEGSANAQAERTLFQEAATQGQSVFAAAGDSGADDCQNSTSAAVDDPASQPEVTGVGGTTLSSATPGGSERVWNTGVGAGGGGVSDLWSRPSYQTGYALPVSGGHCATAPCREVPDVSADANPSTGYAIYYNGSWSAFGGTSAAAPTWAALTALADALPACTAGHGRVGLANTALYTAAGTGYLSDFKDITSGTNGYDTVTGFWASSGYDMASGLGSPVAGPLAPAMCGDLVRVTQPGPQNSTLAASQSVQLAATSSAGTAMTWQASNLPPGLTLDAATGLISGTPTTSGTWTVTAVATDASGSAGDQQFAWTVSAPGAASPATTDTTATTTTAPVVTTTATTTLVAPVTTTTAPPPATPAPAPPPAANPAPPAAPVITLRRPAGLITRARQTVRLRLQAQDSAGLAVRYRASGLPAGVRIGAATGVIFGTPRRRGRTAVTVIATDSGGSSAAVVFMWTVTGRSRITTDLTVGRSGRPTLWVGISAARRAAPLRQVRIAAPAQLAQFATRSAVLARGVTVRGRSGRRLRARVAVSRGGLVVTVAGRPAAATIRVVAPAIAGALVGRASPAGAAPMSVSVRLVR